MIFLLKTIIAFIILHFHTRNMLIKKLKSYIEIKDFRFYPEFSGKISIYKICKIILGINPEKDSALIPDYICNVVNLAVEKDGFKILVYKTNELFEPSEEEIIEQLLNNNKIGVLITASIFGSSAFLENLKKKEIYKIISQKNIHVIVDLCQDLSLVKELPSNYGKNLSCAISFNDKSIPGVGGGGILAKFQIEEYRKNLTPSQIKFLYKWLIKKLFSNFSNKIKRILTASKIKISSLKPLSYEYGRCVSFPWSFIEVRISKIQLILGIIGLMNLNYFQKRKQFLLNKIPDYIVKTKYYRTASFLVLSNIENDKLIELNRRIKPTYAVNYRPDYSLRPNIIIIHNKGFYDE